MAIIGMDLISGRSNARIWRVESYPCLLYTSAIGFALALIIFAGIREQLAMTHVPEGMKGTPIALITAGLLAMAFMGFSGIV